MQRQRPRATRTINKQTSQGGSLEKHMWLVARFRAASKWLHCAWAVGGLLPLGTKQRVSAPTASQYPRSAPLASLAVPAPVRRPLSADFTLEMHPPPASTNLPMTSKLTFPGVRWFTSQQQSGRGEKRRFDQKRKPAESTWILPCVICYPNSTSSHGTRATQTGMGNFILSPRGTSCIEAFPGVAIITCLCAHVHLLHVRIQ